MLAELLRAETRREDGHPLPRPPSVEQVHERLHADDVCSPVGQLANAGRTRPRDGQVNDTDIGKRKVHDAETVV